MRMTLVIGAACVALAGCSGGSSGGGEPATTPAPTVSTATAQQYASVVAASAAAIRKNARAIRGCALVASQTATTCAVLRLTAGFSAKTLVLRLRGAMEESSKVYVGPPPAELESLVQSTMADARAVMRVAKDGHNDYGAVSIAQDRLLHDLDGWRPYGA